MAYTTINKGSLYMNTITWTADGTSPRSFTGVGFQPDLVWGKRRSVAADHNLFDVVRGVGSDKSIQSNTASVEGDASPSFGYLSSLDSDGFTTTTGSTNNNYWNNGTDTYVGWNWKAGGTASSNTDGSITSSVSVNTTSGFSVVTWTGTGANATVGHGLGSVPKMIILKNRDSAENWIVGHTSIDWTKYLSLNTTDATSTASNIWQDTTPTSSFFSIGASGKVNGSTHGMVAYCFADVKGFSKFGSYAGNSSSDGTFVYTGFKPAFVMVKRYDGGSQGWNMFDNKRDPFNLVDEFLIANSSNAEATGGALNCDFLSNGFKFRGTDGGSNTSGSSYIYLAFAENPFVGSDGTPVTAR